jgi:hypothetical protein
VVCFRRRGRGGGALGRCSFGIQQLLTP